MRHPVITHTLKLKLPFLQNVPSIIYDLYFCTIGILYAQGTERINAGISKYVFWFFMVFV
jgi:hypothetical protein